MTERCPICGADVDRDDPAATSYFDGDLFYFCCDTCKEEFDANPERFVRIAA